MKTYNILIVEDDKKIALVLRDYLQQENYKVTLLYRGDEVMHEFRAHLPDVILLDILLPGEDGLKISKKIRAISDVPIIFITAKTDVTDRLVGLELGADDYICKPFIPQEVVARVKAVLRRTHSKQMSQLLVEGPITIDLTKHRVTIFDSELRLTPIEFDLLKVLASRPGQVFTRNDLISAIQGTNFDGFERTIDSHISKLRKKIASRHPEEKFIHTIYSIGYSFDPKLNM